MKIALLLITLLISASSFALDRGEGICMKTLLDNGIIALGSMAKSECRGVTEGQANCMTALLDNGLSTYASIAKSECKGVTEGQGICMQALLNNRKAPLGVHS